MTITNFEEYSVAAAERKKLGNNAAERRIELYLAMLNFELNGALIASGMKERNNERNS